MATKAEKIESLKAIINSPDIPQNVKDDAKSKIEQLEKEETSAEKKEEKAEEKTEAAATEKPKGKRGRKKGSKNKPKEEKKEKKERKSHKKRKKHKKHGATYARRKAKKAEKEPKKEVKKPSGKKRGLKKGSKNKPKAHKAPVAVKTPTPKHVKGEHDIYKEIDHIANSVEKLKPEISKLEKNAQIEAEKKIRHALSTIKFEHGGEVGEEKHEEHHSGERTVMSILFGKKKEYAKGGNVPHHPHLEVDKGHSMPHGYDVVKGSDKKEDYSEGAKHVHIDKGFRAEHGYETKKGDKKKQYKKGGHLTFRAYGLYKDKSAAETQAAKHGAKVKQTKSGKWMAYRNLAEE